MSLAFTLALALCLTLLAGCANGHTAQEMADMQPTQQTPTSPLEGITADSRVVALTRSLADMWLLSGGQLVGVTEDALGLDGLSPDAVSVGKLDSPSLDQVLALKPDLVLLAEDLPSNQELYAGLMGANVPALLVNINSFDDYALTMEALTGATGRADLYETNVMDVRVRIDEVVAHNMMPDRGTYVALRTSSSKNKALRNDHFACAMLNDLGLSNVAQDNAYFDEVSVEAIAQANPAWVFVIYQGDVEKAQKAFESEFQANPMWSQLDAVKQGHVVMLPKELFQYKPNARWAEAYGYLSQVLHGSWA